MKRRWVFMVVVEVPETNPAYHWTRRQVQGHMEHRVRQVFGPDAEMIDFRSMAAQPSDHDEKTEPEGST